VGRCPRRHRALGIRNVRIAPARKLSPAFSLTVGDHDERADTATQESQWRHAKRKGAA